MVAQSPTRETSAITLAVGSGSVTSEWFRRLYTHPDGFFSTDDLGGLTVSLRTLVRAPFAPSRLRIGGEVGLFMILTGGAASSAGGSGVSCGPGCTFFGPAVSPPDDAGIHFGGLASLRLFTAGRVTMRVTGGGGLLFLNLNDAGPAQKQNFSMEFTTNRAYFEETPGPDPYYTIRIAPTILFTSNPRMGLGIEPYVSLLKATGDAAVKSVSFGAAFVIQW